MDKYFRMNKIVSTHDDKVKIAEATNKFADHPHISRVALAIQTIYAPDTRGNSPTMVKSNMSPVDKIRQRPVRASWKIGQGIKSLDPVTVKIRHFRKVK